MSELICEFCNKTFNTKYSLQNHQKTAKFCLEIRNKQVTEEFKCEFCFKIFQRKDHFSRHLKNCKSIEKNKVDSLQKRNDEYYNEIIFYKEKFLNLELDTKNIISELQLQIKELKKENQFYKMVYEEEKSKNIKLDEEYKSLSTKAIENAGNKTTTINNTRNQVYNNLLPLTEEYMKEQTKFLTYNTVKNGAHGLAHFASNHTFKDRIFCSDKSRLNFVFKNEDDYIIKDPEGIEITKKFIEINREELVRLVDEYINYIISQLNDDSTTGDVYKAWAQKREEFFSIRSAVKNGNISENKDSYQEFKKNFLLALSNLVPR